MFWEVKRGGALILPVAQGLVFISRRSRRCGAANQICASNSMLNPDSKREGASRRGRSGTLRFKSGYLSNGGSVEKTQQMANDSDPRTTKLCDRSRDEVPLEVEGI